MKKILLSLLFLLFLACNSFLIAQPQAVIFDFGGVLNLEANNEPAALFIRNTLHLSPTEFATAAQEGHLWSKAGMTETEFWNMYAHRRGVKLPSDWNIKLEPLLKNAVGADEKMYRLIEELKAQGLRVGLLSNVLAGRAKMLKEFGFYSPFQPSIVSSDVNLAKPDPQIYLLLLKELNLPAQDVIFVDDKASNIDAARKLGIDGIVFHSEQQLREELSKRKWLTP